MCDVHLVSEIDELRVADVAFACGECGQPIIVGESYRFIEGMLDDGSGERWRYRAHDDCYAMTTLDYDNDGCFVFGLAEQVV